MTDMNGMANRSYLVGDTAVGDNQFTSKTKKYEIGIFGTKAMVKLMIGGLILIFLGASASLVVFQTLTDVPVASSGITNSTSGN